MRFAAIAMLMIIGSAVSVFANGDGVLNGTVVDSSTNKPIYGLTVGVAEISRLTSTNERGEFSFKGLAEGTYTVRVSGVGWNPMVKTVDVTEGTPATITFTMSESAKNMGEVIVYGASRAPEKLTSAPAAISVVTPLQIEQASSHGSVGKTMETIVGVDVVQSGSNDFNINSRGFNNSINRRMLVLIDGRDPSTPLINLNEWNSLTSLLGDISSIEVVRGPGSALYGSNAYNGVVNIRTTDPKEVLGTRVNLVAGEWETYKGSIRHAGEFGDFAYKVNVGYRQQLNYSLTSRDTTHPDGRLEYPGLAPDVWPLPDEARRPYAFVATGRLDYYFDPSARLVLEGGYSNSGNEFYVNQTGRILIKEVARPFTRLAYNSENFNVQALWQRRVAPKAQLVYNARATSGEESDVYSIDAQWNDTFLDDKLRLIVGAQHEQQFVNTTYDYEIDTAAGERRLPLLDPDNQRGIFTGVYAQAEYQIADPLKVVGAIRFDETNFDFPLQISPKVALVFEPITGQSFRFTYNRSWLRPSFADFFRKSPAGLPVNLAGVERTVDSVTSEIVGSPVQSNLGLGATAQWNLGNPTLTPETAQSFELGYRGTAFKRLFVEVNAYWNRRADLISNPLGGLAPNVYPSVQSNTGNAATNAIADSVLRAELAKINPLYPDRLAVYQNSPALVVVPTNIAIVDELGVEIGATYFLTNELSVRANYSYLSVEVQDNEVEVNRILPNTSPHRVNLGMEYMSPGEFDANLNLRYVEGFNWIAGLIEGHVPAYAVMNLSAGYFVMKDLRVGLNVFNLLDRRHYEIFGGTILRREVTGSLTYTF